MSIKQQLRRTVRRFTVARSFLGQYSHDRRRFYRFSSAVSPTISQQNLASRITGSYHGVEKGLALPEPRPGFGVAPIGRLIGYLNEYLDRFGEDEVTGAAMAALNAYVTFNRGHMLADSDIVHFQAISDLRARCSATPGVGGTKLVDRDAVLAAVAGVGSDFFATRSSVRQFAPRPVDTEDIEFAVRAAQRSPAVCNRQYSRVYVISNTADIQRALEIQGGARGFGEQVPTVAVITSNIRNFWGIGERMQPWTDGGMFAMSFILGLHARGIGSVCLNWSKTQDVDEQFRSAFGLPEEEIIIMLIAFGHLREQYSVAVSPRIPLERTLHSLGSAPDLVGTSVASPSRQAAPANETDSPHGR